MTQEALSTTKSKPDVVLRSGDVEICLHGQSVTITKAGRKTTLTGSAVKVVGALAQNPDTEITYDALARTCQLSHPDIYVGQARLAIGQYIGPDGQQTDRVQIISASAKLCGFTKVQP